MRFLAIAHYREIQIAPCLKHLKSKDDNGLLDKTLKTKLQKEKQ